MRGLNTMKRPVSSLFNKNLCFSSAYVISSFSFSVICGCTPPYVSEIIRCFRNLVQVAISMIHCRRCNVPFPAETFRSKLVKGKMYLDKICPTCLREQYREKHPLSPKPPKTSRLQRSSRPAMLKHKYGLSIEQYDRMFLEQNGVCAICGNPPAPTGKPQQTRLHVDHDHQTGQIRGLLCRACNHGIGSLRDSTAILQSAISYLENASAPGLVMAPPMCHPLHHPHG